MAINALYHQSPVRLEEELRIIEKAKVNPAHFGPLYSRYHESIFRYIFRRVEDIEAAYDITSQVFVKAIGALPKFEYRGVPFSSWLFRIAKSELYQFFRDSKANRMVSIDSVRVGQVMDEFMEDHS
jgi:RNA polymerase sigma-70 factor (ECF subfamily)